MSVLDLFSKRQKRKRGELPDVYQYEELSDQLRGQIVYILRDSIGDPTAYGDEDRNTAAGKVYDMLCREYGTFRLYEGEGKYTSKQEALYNFILNEKNMERCLDAIELSFRWIDKIARPYYNKYAKGWLHPDEAIKELNQRFQEAGFGYQYENGVLIRMDSKLVHSEVVKPALKLLNNPVFKNANEEFLGAHEDYRHGDYDDCVHKCAKALETTLKIICKKRKWQYKETDAAKKLISVVLDNGLIPKYLQTHFSSFQQMLESGVPTIRNKEGGHGKGNKKDAVESHVASFQLHQTAVILKLLLEAEQNL